MSKSSESVNQLLKEQRFRQLDLDHIENKYLEETEQLKLQMKDVDYEDFMAIIKIGKGQLY